jgi:zona occludens toxin
MIELYEGVPGSGKSYHAICEKFLPWVRHRPTALYRGGWDLSGSAAVVHRHRTRNTRTTDHHLERLRRSLQAFPHVEPGSAVIIDEAQTVFRSMQKVEPGCCVGSKPIGTTAWIFCS